MCLLLLQLLLQLLQLRVGRCGRGGGWWARHEMMDDLGKMGGKAREGEWGRMRGGTADGMIE